MKRSLIWLFLVLILYACGERRSGDCIPPPEEFSEVDLVGTWISVSGGPGREDVLMIRGDKTYKQFTNVASEDFDYESDWQPWWLENVENGIPYLHLEGMRLCAYVGGYIDCNVVGGGEATQWYDLCRETWVLMPGEGVLAVLGTPKGFIPPPRGIRLALFQRSTDGWGYWLQEATEQPATVSP